MTKTLTTAVLFLATSLGISFFAFANEKPEQKKTAVKTERVITPMKDVTNFVVEGRSTIFRLNVSAISGSSFSDPKITGNAMHLRTADLITVNEDGDGLIGSIHKEFEFRGTAPGKVKIVIEVQSPTQDKPTSKVFNVTIK